MLAIQCWLVLWNYDEFEHTHVDSSLLSDVAEGKANCYGKLLVLVAPSSLPLLLRR